MSHIFSWWPHCSKAEHLKSQEEVGNVCPPAPLLHTMKSRQEAEGLSPLKQGTVLKRNVIFMLSILRGCVTFQGGPFPVTVTTSIVTSLVTNPYLNLHFPRFVSPLWQEASLSPTSPVAGTSNLCRWPPHRNPWRGLKQPDSTKFTALDNTWSGIRNSSRAQTFKAWALGTLKTVTSPGNTKCQLDWRWYDVIYWAETSKHWWKWWSLRSASLHINSNRLFTHCLWTRVVSATPQVNILKKWIEKMNTII